MNEGHNSDDKQKYNDAGEPVARVLSEFVSLAGEFSKKFEQTAEQVAGQHQNSRYTTNSSSVDKGPAEDQTVNGPESVDQVWKAAGDYLQELRLAAGYTIDGFAKAMNQQGADDTIRAAEEGRELFPMAWLEQASKVLNENDPREFIDTMQRRYQESIDTFTEAANQVANQVAGQTARNTTNRATTHEGQATRFSEQAMSDRQLKLAGIFSDESMKDLTDEQFEQLLTFVRANYNSALQLVKSQKFE